MELIATEARKIDKEKVTDPEYTAVNGKIVTDEAVPNRSVAENELQQLRAAQQAVKLAA